MVVYIIVKCKSNIELKNKVVLLRNRVKIELERKSKYLKFSKRVMKISHDDELFIFDNLHFLCYECSGLLALDAADAWACIQKNMIIILLM